MAKQSKESLEELLRSHSRVGELFRNTDDLRIECFACGHRCRIAEGREGVCKIRFNQDGKLRVPWGYVSSIALDPIEKKPFFHVLPGAKALSFGMLGCDYHCPFCQNWITSQALRDPESVSEIETISPEDIVKLARLHDARVVTSTYNEPLITTEWAVEIFKIARGYNMITSYVSNGNGTLEVIDYLKPWLNLFKIDLKGFNEKKYRELGGDLNIVLDTIKTVNDKKIWMEIVTLIVPGFNDSPEELKDISQFISSVSPDIPWHVTAYHNDYKMDGDSFTPPQTIIKAAEIGNESGLHYVYAGNLHGDAKNFENTYCHSCRTLLIERRGFVILKNQIDDGRCPKCFSSVPGVWN